MPSLKRKAIKSIKWTAIQTAIVGISGTVLLLVQARFLSPEEFGQMAVIFIVIGIIELFENFGINQAIIQRNSITLEESSTLFFFNIIFSIFFAVTLYIFAPLIAQFFSMPAIIDYLRIALVIPLIVGPSALFHAFLEKQLHFQQLSIVEIARNLIVLVLTIFFLVWGLGVSGVIFAKITGCIFSTISILYITLRYKTVRIAFYFAPAKLRPFLRFGVFVTAKDLLTYSTNRLDEVLIVYFLAPEILGIYYFGKNMLERVRRLITMSFGKVLFPVLSKLKRQPERLTFAYMRISQYVAFVAFPIFAGIAATANLFVPVIFGEKWIDSIIVFQVFSVALIFMVLTANISSSLLYAVNKPAQVFYIDLATNSLYFISLFLFASKGMVAVLIAYSMYVVYKTLILQYFANRQLIANFSRYFRNLTIPAVSAAVMVAAILVFQKASAKIIGNELQFAGSIVIGISAYAVIGWFFARDTLRQLHSVVMKGDIVG